MDKPFIQTKLRGNFPNCSLNTSTDYERSYYQSVAELSRIMTTTYSPWCLCVMGTRNSSPESMSMNANPDKFSSASKIQNTLWFT